MLARVAPHLTPFRRWAGGLTVALLCVVAASSEVVDELPGTWTMSDESPELFTSFNPEQFTISRVIPGEMQWADGTFFFKWRGDAQPVRGYYSLETGRVWVTTYRMIDQKEYRVEYTGSISRDGKITWEGIAKTTGSARKSWDFVATRN